MATVRKVGTYGPDKLDTGEYELRWRLYMTEGRPRERRRAFVRKGLADAYGEKLHKAADHVVDRRTGRRWGWSAGLEPILLETAEPDGRSSGDTVWKLVTDWRTATWRTASGNGRKSQAFSLRAMAHHLVVNPGSPIPESAAIYLSALAFRGPSEPTLDVLRSQYPDGKVPFYENRRRVAIAVEEVWRGRQWLEKESLPLADLDRARLRALLGALGRGRSPVTERRYWTTVQSVLIWGADETVLGSAARVAPGITAGIEVRTGRHRSVDEVGEVPTVEEMWRFGLACGLAAGRRSGGRWCALPVIMGGAGLRIGECAALLRRHVRDDPATGGMWIDVRGSRSTPGRAWTDNGERAEERGTKRRGTEGNRKGRTTYLPPRESEIVRLHLDLFVDDHLDAPVFTGASGARVDVPRLQRDIWKPARLLAFPAPHRLAELDRHAFRHLAATRWLRAGVPLTTAARWGGWQNVSTMVDFYDSVLPNDDDGAAALMAG